MSNDDINDDPDLRARIAELEHDLLLSACMLARQCDAARQAETGRDIERARADRAERVVAWLLNHRREDIGCDIDGGDLQDMLLEVGYLVTVPVGFHKDCDSCEDGALDCIEVAPEFARLMEVTSE